MPEMLDSFWVINQPVKCVPDVELTSPFFAPDMDVFHFLLDFVPELISFVENLRVQRGNAIELVQVSFFEIRQSVIDCLFVLYDKLENLLGRVPFISVRCPSYASLSHPTIILVSCDFEVLRYPALLD